MEAWDVRTGGFGVTRNSSRLKVTPSSGVQGSVLEPPLLQTRWWDKKPKGLHQYSQVNKPTATACSTKWNTLRNIVDFISGNRLSHTLQGSHWVVYRSDTLDLSVSCLLKIQGASNKATSKNSHQRKENRSVNETIHCAMNPIYLAWQEVIYIYYYICL